MSSDIVHENPDKPSPSYPSTDISLAIAKIKNSIWMMGIPSWLFGISDRGIAAFGDGYLSTVEAFHLLTTTFLFVSWLYLKPEKSFGYSGVDTLKSYENEQNCPANQEYLGAAQSRMLQLQDQHMISQEYVLPFPYICQIYHLLNLKHLESIHYFSLNNLRVVKVSQVQPTAIGGKIKFQTLLDSPFNVLRIWRQPIVEVDLSLHTPYTVELSIPVYNGKRITVIFNALPLHETEHRLLIDIYSDLQWPKPLLQVILHFAACLTLFEDLPYLQKLAERNLHRLANLNRVPNHETMWLYKRFVDLYGPRLQPAQTLQAIA